MRNRGSGLVVLVFFVPTQAWGMAGNVLWCHSCCLALHSISLCLGRQLQVTVLLCLQPPAPVPRC